MGCLSLVWSLIKVYIVCLIITFMPGLPPMAEYKEYNVVRPKALNAELLQKKNLDKAERILEGKLTGPEAFAIYNGAVYTGIHGGFVVQIDEGEMRPVVKFGQHCEDIFEEHLCGRPLGMKFDAAGNLYVADAYYGIFKYNIQKAEKTLLVGVNEVIEGKESKLINDVAVAKDGTVYFTVSSTVFPLYEIVQAALATGDGRIIKYDPRTRKASVLADGLLMPNGLALSANEDYLVFTESPAVRVMRYDLKGAKAGTLSVFAEGLPGVPDNIRVDGRDGFYVSLVDLVDESHPSLLVSFGPFPLIRKFIGRVISLLELPFVQINKVYPNYFCRRAAHMIGHYSSICGASPDGVTILHLDSQGQIKDALVGRDGSINHISDMVVAGDYILLGSPVNNYIGRVPRPNAPGQIHVKSVRFEEATPEDRRKDEAAARKLAEEAQAKKIREEQVKKAAEEAARAKKASEEASRRAAEEARIKKEAENAAKKAAEEAQRKKEAANAAKAAAEEARLKKEAESAAKKAAEEARRKMEAEAAAQKAAAQKAAAQKIAAQKAAEEARRKKEADEAQWMKEAEEAKKRAKNLAEAGRKSAEEEESKLKKASGNTDSNCSSCCEPSYLGLSCSQNCCKCY